MTAATTEEELASRVRDGGGTVLVRFSADWCVPCRAMAPVIESVADEHDLDLVHIDVERHQDLVSRYGVQSIPTVILFEDGRKRRQAVGPMPRLRLEHQLGLAEESF